MKTRMTIFASLLLAGFTFTSCDDDNDNYTPDEKIAQYALLFEHPSQVTASEEQPGRYWKNYKEK